MVSRKREVRHQDITLATEAFGQPDNPPVLLIMGATASMLGWPDEFCAMLAERGLYVIRFDHRDTGQSTTVPPGEASYTVEDLAGDALAILDDYGLVQANLVGMSLGGYIAQMLAVTKAARIASLTLIASEPLGWDGRELPQISEVFLDHFGSVGTLDWADKTAAADFLVQSERLCAGTAALFDEARVRARVAHIMSRTVSLPSMFNHGALTTREDWTGQFREIICPTLVVHGSDDPILPVENGRAIADGIHYASLVVLAKTGHELPPHQFLEITERIASFVHGN